MAEISYRKLDADETRVALDALNAGLSDPWAIEGGALGKEFAFDEYANGLVFAVAVGWAAERLNHHPDLLVGYRRVRATLSTHDASGLTAYDFEMARRIESIR